MKVLEQVVRFVAAASLAGCLALIDDRDHPHADAAPDVDAAPARLSVTHAAYIKAAPNVAQALFGNQVALSADGTTLAVSATGFGEGNVDVYTRSSAAGWQHQAHITPSGTSSFFGSALALSADGNTLAVGAQYDPVDCACPASYGATYMYTRTGSTWSGEQRLLPSRQGDGFFFGNAVSLSADGETLAIGAIGTGPSTQQTFMGAAYVFTRSGSAWTETTYIPGPEDYANLGGALALSGDGTTLVVSEANHIGALAVFVRVGDDWSRHARLVGSDVAVGDFFGSDVAVSGDGSIIVAGSIQPPAPIPATGPGGNGAVYVFKQGGADWIEQAKLVASNGELLDAFGSRVVLDAPGRLLFVSAPSEDGGATGVDGDQASASAPNSGAVYSFRRDAAGWTQQSYIKASNTGEGDSFGYSGLALSSDGATLAVGSLDDSSASGIGGDGSDNESPRSGAVHVYAIE
jgi:hypothetical protein